MNRLALLPMLCAVLASPVAAQMPADTGHAARLHRVAGRWRETLGLTDDQATKLKTTVQRFGGQRRAIMERQRALGVALRGQLQPGVAANADSLRKLLDAREQNEGALAQLRRDERREMAAYLTPVQRARLELARQRMAGRFGRGHRWGHGWDGRHRPPVENE
jgi:Spy/CpxP family protein refolding chaperone